MNSAFIQTGIYSATATFSPCGGLTGAGAALIGGDIPAPFKNLTASSDDTSVGFTAAPNTTGYQAISGSTTNLREDFAVPSGSSITVDDLEAFAGGTTALGTTSGTNEVPVAIWETSGSGSYDLLGSGPLATGTLTSTDSTRVGTTGYYELSAFTPVTLAGATSYTIIASYPALFDFYNANISGAHSYGFRQQRPD